MTRIRVTLLALVVAASLALAGCLGGTDPGLDPADAPHEGGGPPPAKDAPDEDAARSAGSADGANGTAAPGPDAPRVILTVTNGTITALAAGGDAAAFGTICCIGITRDGENLEGAFTPAGNLTGVVLELAWEDATADLDLALRAPDYGNVFPPEVNGTGLRGSRGHAWWDYGGQAGAPDGPVAIHVTDPEALAVAGEWAWEVRGKYAQGTPFTVYLTLFHGETPADDYSAIPA